MNPSLMLIASKDHSLQTERDDNPMAGWSVDLQ